MLWSAGMPIFLSFLAVVQAKCPHTLPVKVDNQCFAFVPDFYNFEEAKGNCMRLHGGASITSYKTSEVLRRMESVVVDYVTQKMDKAVFWIGLKMEDYVTSKRNEDREWTWEYDDSTFVQKDYPLWSQTGGPSESGTNCAIINGTDSFRVSGLDCDGPRFSPICMMEDNKVCKSENTVPYLQYGDFCVAVMNDSIQGKSVGETCSPEKGALYKQDMHDIIVKAARNSFLGGAVYQNIKKFGSDFFDQSDGTSSFSGMWEDGEPRDEYECVGLSLQADNSLKLKTMSCNFTSTSLCFVADNGLGTYDGEEFHVTFSKKGILLNNFGK